MTIVLGLPSTSKVVGLRLVKPVTHLNVAGGVPHVWYTPGSHFGDSMIWSLY